jgi:hypothetical protein
MHQTLAPRSRYCRTLCDALEKCTPQDPWRDTLLQLMQTQCVTSQGTHITKDTRGGEWQTNHRYHQHWEVLREALPYNPSVDL